MAARWLDFRANLADYARYHERRGNRLCHGVGIPLIMLAIVRWTQWPGFPWVPGAAVVLPLYVYWDAGLGLAMAAVILAMAAVAQHLSPVAVWTAFILGWIFQFVGHAVFEKKSPAFTRNLIHLLVGPMWILKKALTRGE
ncbi:MAG: DUF962 domain-containing protein [Elusimicrobia bacterium]|nr:DUF962 domain-containing protein [Elusimicrobiota bacterium]